MAAPSRLCAQMGIVDTVRAWATAGTNAKPHPAVVKVYTYDENAVARGSGTLIHVAGDTGFVLSNWHVVRDAPENVEVVFPDDFRSRATVVKTDERWDLALLAIRAPKVAPMPMARSIPRIGDLLTIAGYGSDHYRAVRGRCAHFVAPEAGAPFEMIEVDVSARQGDSGGPIMNAQGELAAVLFGTGQGMTTGSHIGRVNQFLAEVRKELGAEAADSPPPSVESRQGAIELPPPFQLVAVPAEVHIDRPQAAVHLQAVGRTTSASVAPMVPIGPSAESVGNPTTASLASASPSAAAASTPAAVATPASGDASSVSPTPGPSPAPFNPLAPGMPLPADAVGSRIALASKDGRVENASHGEAAASHNPAASVANDPFHASGDPVAMTSDNPLGRQVDATAGNGGSLPSQLGMYTLPPRGAVGYQAAQVGSDTLTWNDLAGDTLWDKTKSVFALAGVLAVAYVLLHINPS